MKMHCFPAVIGLLLVLIENAASWRGNYCIVQVCAYRWERRCYYRTWNGCCGYRWYKVSYWRKDYSCCPGWKTSTYQNCNVAICSPRCIPSQGNCTTPNTCTCDNAFKGPLCDGIATCSYLDPCYPGACNSRSKCTCSEGFDGADCREFVDDKFVPTINRCNATFTYHDYQKGMDIYSYFGDATNLTEPFVLWTNQDDFNILEMTMEAIYDTEYNIQQALPTKPDYVYSMKLGIVDANVMTRHTKISGSTVYEKNFKCSQPSQNNPILNEVMVCMLNGTNNIRVDSGDIFTLKFTVTSGGVIRYQNKDNPDVITDTRYYTGKTAESTVEFKFDYMEPTHCITNQPPCSDDPLHLDKDITKESIKPTWKGWTDDLSEVFKYSVELWKMEFSLDNKYLREPLITVTSNPVPLYIEETNITEPLQFPVFTPPEAGIYSCILEVSDEANNTRYARRFVIYDNTSQVTVQDENPLYCMSASEPSGYKWQTNINNDNDGKTRVDISWADHFVNEVHEAGHFLSPVGLYQPRLTDGGRRVDYKKIEEPFDDIEGTRTKYGIENVNSIVKFEFAHQIPPVVLANIVWSPIPGLNQSNSLTLSGVNDGYVHQFFIRATDIMGNQMIDSTTIRFDSTKPYIEEPELDYNVQDGSYDFSSRFTIVSRDDHSGVPIVKVKIVTKDGTTKYEHTYENIPMADGNCDSCYCTPNKGGCYKSKMTFDINNCWMGVAIDDTGTEMHRLEIAAYNGAMLSDMKTHDILDVGNLTGIQKYYGIDNLEIVSISDTAVRIQWDQPKSCYDRLGIKLMLTLGNNIIEFKIYKDATSFDITGLKPSSSYSFQLFTKYGTDDNFVMSEPVTMSMTTTAEQVSGLQAGGIAGITIGFIVLVVVFVVIFIFLHRSGRLSKAQERVETGLNTIRQTVKRAPNIRQTVKRAPAFDNKAYSQGGDDDIYIYSGMEFNSGSAIPRDCIAFDSEISRGRFAIIYKVYMNQKNGEKETAVAKTLKDNSNELDIQTMKAKIMFYDTVVGHDKNVLDFKGSVEYDIRGPFMLLEYCEYGSIKDYLKIHKDRVNEDLEERLYRFSFGICMGMNYLATKKIVHKRLAARNILLNFLLEPKITGFGPDPASVEDNDSTSERIPVKWMAPECMTSTRKATEKSDVWSYGIVLWEIFTIGETPYPDVRSQNLPNWLKQNKRNAKPGYCDDSFFKMMKKCWQYEPNKRPNFLKLKQELSEMFSEGQNDEVYYKSSAIYDNNINQYSGFPVKSVGKISK